MSENSFLVVARDKTGADAQRAQHREAHVAYLKGKHETVRVEFGGPLSSDNGGSAGTFLIVTAPSLDAAKNFVEADPFSKAGIFSNIEITPCKVTIKA